MAINFARFSTNGGWWVVGQFGLFVLIFLAFSQNTDPAPWSLATGWVLIGMALILAGSGLWTIRRRVTAMPAPRQGAVLMESGPFSLVRHPVYGGVILGFIGLSLRGGNPLALAISLMLVPFFYAKTRHEERLLVARFPQYADYRMRVRRRFLPWIL